MLDAEHKARDCWHLDLTAATGEAVYSRIEYWLEQGSYRPIKGKYYSDSGRLLKIAYFHRYQTQLDAQRPTESIIIDAVDSNLVTTMSTSDYLIRRSRTPGSSETICRASRWSDARGGHHARARAV